MCALRCSTCGPALAVRAQGDNIGGTARGGQQEGWHRGWGGRGAAPCSEPVLQVQGDASPTTSDFFKMTLKRFETGASSIPLRGNLSSPRGPPTSDPVCCRLFTFVLSSLGWPEPTSRSSAWVRSQFTRFW